MYEYMRISGLPILTLFCLLKDCPVLHVRIRSSADAVSKMRAVNLGHKHLHVQHPRANTRSPRCQVSRIFWVHLKLAHVYCPCTSNPSRKPASSSLRSPQVHAVHTKHCLNDVHCRCCPTAHTSKSTLRAHSPIEGPSALYRPSTYVPPRS